MAMARLALREVDFADPPTVLADSSGKVRGNLVDGVKHQPRFLNGFGLVLEQQSSATTILVQLPPDDALIICHSNLQLLEQQRLEARVVAQGVPDRAEAK